MKMNAKLSEDKLKKIAIEKERQKKQKEAKKLTEYNYSFTSDQRAIRIKKIKATRKAREEAAKRMQEKLSKKEEKKAQLIQKELEKKKAEEQARLSAKRFYDEIADRIVFISSRLSSSRLSNDPNKYNLF